MALSQSQRMLLRRRWLVASVLLAAPTLIALSLLGLMGTLDWLLVSLAGLAVLIGVAIPLGRHYRHVGSLLAYVEQLAEVSGDERLPAAPGSGGSLLTPGLREAIIETAEERQRRRRELHSAVTSYEATAASLPDPLILLDRERHVVRANPAAHELLGEQLEGRELTSVLRNPDLLAAADAAIRGERTQVVAFSLAGPLERHLVARVAPLPEPAFGGALALLTLHDVTGIRRAEQLRADFVANASHELRTPLSSLTGFIETLLGPAFDDEAARRRFLTIMNDQAQRMSRLVDDLMSLSRIEMQEHTPPVGRVELNRLLPSVVGGLELKAQEKDMSLLLDLPQLPEVIGETDDLTQIFQNLVDNAIKYGRAGSEVRIEARFIAAGSGPRGHRIGGPSVAVAILDQGEGIAREHIPRLTERFYRVDTARSRELGGTGLGLAIVKHLVNRHRGQLEIESEIGKGSRFTVYLPTADAKTSADAAE